MIKLRTIGSAAILSAFTFGSAMAADLGGNCCADLEERIAELEATTARKGNRKVSVEVSGHVNQAVIFTDIDGFSPREFIDNENSESRFRFKGSSKINSDWTAGFLMEFGLAGLTNGGGDLNVRHNVLWLKSKQLGTFYLGKTGQASDGIMEISLTNANEASMLASLAPFDAHAKRQTGFGLNNPFDGSRKQLIKYVSPELGGFSVSSSWSDDETWDVALRYAGEFGGIRVGAGVAYRDDGDITPLIGVSGTREFWGGSVSVMHVQSGLYVDAAYGQSDGVQTGTFTIPVINFDVSFGLGDAKVEIMHGRVGVWQKVIAAGKTNIFVEYGQLQIAGTSVEPTLYGVGIVQSIDAAAMDLYASYRHLDADLGPDSQADVFVAGAKIKF